METISQSEKLCIFINAKWKKNEWKTNLVKKTCWAECWLHKNKIKAKDELQKNMLTKPVVHSGST